ncbi:MAG: PQQ-binding-like beta-propeller repeat protein [Candidatus Bathyarchaeota archaeon]|nr:PQQ-binding-like beta-propeller repeat protein [Candidatus Bathyarchaeota archaeon]
MTISKGKTTTIAAALLIILAMAISLLALPGEKQYATAQDRKTSYAFIGATPNPVGVNQETLLHIGITQQKQNEAHGGWFDMSVTIERPDGKTDTIDGVTTDSTGGTGRTYVPDIEGTYYLQTHFPAQWYNYSDYWGNVVETFYEASDSEKLALVVQAEPIEYYPGHPLPTEFWTRPINAQLREWYEVSGSSHMDDDYNEAPESPHVLWTKPLTIGGVVGGDIGQYSFEHGDAYQGKFSSRLVVAGILIYTHDTDLRPLVYTAVDIRTGEVIWEKTFRDNRTISFPQLFFWDSYNYHGTFAYLWVTVGNDWYSFDPFTGEPRFSIADMPSGTNIVGENGNIFRYNVDLNRNYMTLWNFSALGSMEGSWSPSGGFGGNIYMEINASATSGSAGARAERAWAWNITIPDDLPGSVRGVKLNDRVVGVDQGDNELTIWGFNLDPDNGAMGRELFRETWKFPDYFIEGNISWVTYNTAWVHTDLDAKIGFLWVKEFRKHYAFSLETGKYLWEQEVPQTSYLDIYSIGRQVAYGRVYTVGQGGQLHCFNATNGKLLWIYNATDPYTEFLWGNYWSLDIEFISKEKIYLFHSEHSPINPLFRGAPAICINATTGEEIWRVNGLFRKTDWGGDPIMGDSVIAMYNSYDQRVYAIGKGPSALTVSAAPKFSVDGDSVLVEGMVTDVSPGTNDLDITMRFPNGVPAVSDESQGEWMKHVYCQFERPADITGVEVTISVLDPNNNSYEVGTATTDASGTFCCEFIPEVPGLYTVIATFKGSASYYGSYAETYLKVNEAPSPTPCPTPTPEPMTDLYVTGFGAGMIIAIVVVGLLLFLMLRKR